LLDVKADEIEEREEYPDADDECALSLDERLVVDVSDPVDHEQQDREVDKLRHSHRRHVDQDDRVVGALWLL
jgi:hypothetical protein